MSWYVLGKGNMRNGWKATAEVDIKSVWIQNPHRRADADMNADGVSAHRALEIENALRKIWPWSFHHRAAVTFCLWTFAQRLLTLGHPLGHFLH